MLDDVMAYPKTRFLLLRSCFALALATGLATAQAGPAKAGEETSTMAATVMKAWPAGVISTIKKPGEWSYEEGVLLDGLAADWGRTKDAKELAYVKASVDKYVDADGALHMNAAGAPFAVEAHSLDNIEMGRAVLFLYGVTQNERYAKAAEFLHAQLAAQPRTASGGYWHKQIYPNQMWLDGAYMAEPFRARYAVTFKHPADLDDIAKQLLLMDDHMRQPGTGLMLHGWDESGAMPWADKKTGLSPEVWARAMGWYAMALVDVLDWFPKDHPKRPALLAALDRTMKAVVTAQDAKTGLWWQVMDKPNVKGNYPEASASAMYVYALAKGVRMGYLPKGDAAHASAGWMGIQREFVRGGGVVGTVKVGGLGGTPYRSGTYEYYVGEGTGENDAKGVGAYLMAGSEMAWASR